MGKNKKSRLRRRDVKRLPPQEGLRGKTAATNTNHVSHYTTGIPLGSTALIILVIRVSRDILRGNRMGPLLVIGIIILVLILISLRQVNEYERGIKFVMGRFSAVVDPGWRIIIPIFESMQKVDIRTKVVEEPDQEAITKDNVSTKITAVIYYKINDAKKAILEVENFYWAVSQLAQTTMRNVIGEVDLDHLLTQRHDVAIKIGEQVEKAAHQWGLDVSSVELKDIKLPDSMVRTMAKQAEAERERRATIINSEGEVVAAKNLANAAKLMQSAPGALHLRTLNSINDISSDQSNTVVFTVPMEILKAIEGFKKR